LGWRVWLGRLLAPGLAVAGLAAAGWYWRAAGWYWLLAGCCWLLAGCCWLLAGCWSGWRTGTGWLLGLAGWLLGLAGWLAGLVLAGYWLLADCCWLLAGWYWRLLVLAAGGLLLALAGDWLATGWLWLTGWWGTGWLLAGWLSDCADEASLRYRLLAIGCTVRACSQPVG
jgi:hypothetical protein